MKFQVIKFALLFVIIIIIVYSEATDPGPSVSATKGEVWPQPVQVTRYDGHFSISAKNFVFSVSETSYNCTLLQKAIDRYQTILSELKYENLDDYLGDLENLTVTLQTPCEENEYPSLESGEAYLLTVTSGETELIADTVWGIIRGLETFSQLIFLELENGSATLRIEETKIFDQPRYAHRGLLLDTARHYVPLNQIYEIVEGLAMNKMNVFHWHIVDDQSFPYVSQKYPELSAKGAYTKRHTYKPEDVKNIIEYARERGIRVVPEFDTPGHTRSWGLSHPELLCEYDGTYGPMDPSKNETYEFVNNILSEAKDLFKDKYVHLGGDEVDYTCWISNPSIVEFMEEHYPNGKYINYYGQKILNMMNDLNLNPIVWEEMFFGGVQLPNTTVVQVWRDWSGQLWQDNIREITADGKKAILSACWYLENVQQTWKNYYDCEPSAFGGSEEQAKLVIGGEACMWGEMINEYNVVPRVFPRISAVAQKLWSEVDSTTDLDMEARRLEEHACRMNKRGVGAQPPNGPGYCEI